jgi:AcrR family transcriptional regulator
MAIPKQRRAPSERPNEILMAALELFVEKGFAATRLDDVAERAGLSKAAIYLYFEDKFALFQGVVRLAIANNLGTAEGMLAGYSGPIAPLIPQLLNFLAGRITETPIGAVAKLVISESRAFPELGRFYLDEVFGRALTMLEGLIARGIADGEFRDVDPALTARSLGSAMLFGALWKTVFEPIGAQPLDLQALARNHADVLLNGLLQRPEVDTR